MTPVDEEDEMGGREGLFFFIRKWEEKEEWMGVVAIIMPVD